MKHKTCNKVMVFGTFDIFHRGHENFLKQAREYGNFLIVVVARDKTVLAVKGKLPRNSEKARLQTIINNGLANEAVLGGLTDKYKIIKKHQPDIICLGYDQQVFTEKLEEKLKEYKLKTKIIRLKPY
ncbi:adenylyltransferase/cytidyltransferase family protein, partial [Patescibacteria group bacterium]|nr:adenylyltransferase/cytidyltransferase family protein [Patescibacteria group bacterium]